MNYPISEWIVFWKFEYSFFIKFCEDEDREMMKIGQIKSTKSWIWISYLSKKHEMEFCQLFYFQVRESPAPLNIPTRTPAPDHLLGGHNELGGTSVEWAWGKRVSISTSIPLGTSKPRSMHFVLEGIFVQVDFQHIPNHEDEEFPGSPKTKSKSY